jgi:hypothetical protein
VGDSWVLEDGFAAIAQFAPTHSPPYYIMFVFICADLPIRNNYDATNLDAITPHMHSSYHNDQLQCF